MGEIIVTFPILVAPEMTDEKCVEQLRQQIEHLIELGALKGTVDDLIKDFEIQKDANMIAVTVPEEMIGMATDKLLTEGAGTSRKMEIPKEMQITELKPVEQVFDRSFSMIQIVDRMKNAMRQPRQRFRYLIMDYKKYYKMFKKSIEKDSEKAQKLKTMFMTDIMGMITEVLPFIEEGKQLAALVGTSQVSPNLNRSARELSLMYRRALKQEKGAGQINKAYWGRLKKAYSDFMTTLMNSVMPGIAEVETKQESRNYSELPDGRISVLSDWKEENEHNDPLRDFKEMQDDSLQEERSMKEYSKTSDGRISLFSEKNNLRNFSAAAQKAFGNAVDDMLPDGLDNSLQDIAQMSHGIRYQDFLGKSWDAESKRKAYGYCKTLKAQLRDNGKINEESKTYQRLVELLKSLPNRRVSDNFKNFSEAAQNFLKK